MLNYCVQREEPGNRLQCQNMNIWGSVIVSTHSIVPLLGDFDQNILFSVHIHTTQSKRGRGLTPND